MRRPLLIGQTLNAAGSRRVARALLARDTGVIARLAQRQSGAEFLDVCAAGVPDEPAALEWLVATVQDAVDLPLSLDTQDVDALRRVLPLCRRPPLLNGFSGVHSRPLEFASVLRDYSHWSVIALCLDERGPVTVTAERVAVAHRLLEKLVGCGCSAEQIIFDPITLPSLSGQERKTVTLDTMMALRREFPRAGVLCAVGNFGYGLSDRRDAELAYAMEARQAGADVFLGNAADSRLSPLLRTCWRPDFQF